MNSSKRWENDPGWLANGCMSVDWWWSKGGKNIRKKTHQAVSREIPFIYCTTITCVSCFCHLTESIYLTVWTMCSVQWQPWPGSIGSCPDNVIRKSHFPEGQSFSLWGRWCLSALSRTQSPVHSSHSNQNYSFFFKVFLGVGGIEQLFWLVSLQFHDQNIQTISTLPGNLPTFLCQLVLSPCA